MSKAITESDTGRGPIFSYGSASFHSPNGSPGLGSDALRNGMRRLAGSLAVYAADLKAEVLPVRLYEAEGGPILSAARSAIDVERGEARAAAEADSNMRAPARQVEPVIMATVWSTYRGLSQAALVRAVEAADLEDLTALVARGNKAGLPVQQFDRVVERYRVTNWAERQKLAARHPLEPSPERILAIGPDLDRAHADARQQLEAHAARLERVKAAEAGAQSLVQFLAAVFATNPTVMLDRVLGRAV